jgi:DNA-binding NarL/FixJ family response regulator
VSGHRPRVLLADDHRIVAEGIARILDESFDVMRVLEDGDALIEAAESSPADIIVCDVVMPGRSGLKVLKELRAKGSGIPFLFLSMHAEPAIVAAAMRAGANGYVLKAKAGRELLTAIETVLGGALYVTPSLAGQHLGLPSRAPRLTERQHSVLVLIAKGKATKQIARELDLSTRTVEAHRYTLMQMFHVHSAIELVRRAEALGLLAPPDVAMESI